VVSLVWSFEFKTYGCEVAHDVDDIVGGGKEKSLSLSGLFVVPYRSIALTVRTLLLGQKLVGGQKLAQCAWAVPLQMYFVEVEHWR